MTLLIFEKFSTSEGSNDLLQQLPPSLRDLLDYSNRQRLASQVNETILESMGFQSEHKLGFYWQMTEWSQKELQKKAAIEGLQEDKEIVFPVLHTPMGDLTMSER